MPLLLPYRDMPDGEPADLAAAKAALLAELNGTLPAAASSTKRSRRRGGRRRPRALQQSAVTSTPSSREPNLTTIDYIPESVHSVVTRADNHQIFSAHQLDEVEDVLTRFARRAVAGADLNPTDGFHDDEGDERDEAGEPPVGRKNTAAQSNEETDRDEREGSEDRSDEERQDAQRDGERDTEGDVMSRKQRKEHQRNLISRLKSLSHTPEVVEAWDITAPDPVLLVHLKSLPNSVPVPSNWRLKRKYLQNKRGMEKRAFQLPAYIVDTGVGELRDAQIEADEKKSLKQRQREKMRAKTGRGVEIDHSRLHDAFFKFQTKPRLTGHGDVYYELRELEVDNSKFRPGVMSEELRAALGLTQDDPPPWLVNMQRYGPPPGYPGLKVAGVNCGIPAGKRYGFQSGGWGKPPVDVNGRPIYGDVFDEGLEFGVRDERFDLTEREKRELWGEAEKVGEEEGLRVVAEEEKGEEAEERKEEKEAEVKERVRVRNEGVGAVEEREEREVRKGLGAGQLYAVLEERSVSVGDKGMMGSSHVYRVDGSGAEEGGVGEKRKREEDDGAVGTGAETKGLSKKQKEFKF